MREVKRREEKRREEKQPMISSWSELQQPPTSQSVSQWESLESLESYFLDSCGIVSSWCLQLRSHHGSLDFSSLGSLWRHSVRRHELSLHQSEARPAGVVQWGAARRELRESPELVAGAPWYSGWGDSTTATVAATPSLHTTLTLWQDWEPDMTASS